MVEQVIGRATHYQGSVLNLLNCIIVELVPHTIVLSIGCVVAALQLAVVVGHAKEVVDQFTPLPDDMVAHVETFQREMHGGVLLLLHPLEPFQVDYQHGRGLEDLELLDCLLVHFASTAEPGILVRELLWCHELSKAVIDGDLIVLSLTLTGGRFLREGLREEAGADEILIEGPAQLRVEGDVQFKLEVLGEFF